MPQRCGGLVVQLQYVVVFFIFFEIKAYFVILTIRLRNDYVLLRYGQYVPICIAYDD